MITTSNDGTIGIVRCGNWQLEKHWLKPHQGLAVDTLAIHPTGKLAMTTGHDGVLRTWNLVKGRQAYATNLVPRWKLDAKNISVLKWSPNGESYVIAANNKVDVYSMETAGIREELTFDTKVVCIEYLDEDYIAVGLTDGNISIHSLQSGSVANVIKAHDARVKCLARDGDLLVSASSAGEIKVWSIKKDDLTYLNKVNCNARISCVTLTSHNKLKTKSHDEDATEVPEKLSNKLKNKKEVIIEEENEEIQEIEIVKKPKLKSEISSKRTINENSDVIPENKKKKIKFSSKIKRKSVTNEIIPLKTKKVKISSKVKTSDENEIKIDSKRNKRKNLNQSKY